MTALPNPSHTLSPQIASPSNLRSDILAVSATGGGSTITLSSSVSSISLWAHGSSPPPRRKPGAGGYWKMLPVCQDCVRTRHFTPLPRCRPNCRYRVMGTTGSGKIAVGGARLVIRAGNSPSMPPVYQPRKRFGTTGRNGVEVVHTWRPDRRRVRPRWDGGDPHRHPGIR